MNNGHDPRESTTPWHREVLANTIPLIVLLSLDFNNDREDPPLRDRFLALGAGAPPILLIRVILPRSSTFLLFGYPLTSAPFRNPMPFFMRYRDEPCKHVARSILRQTLRRGSASCQNNL